MRTTLLAGLILAATSSTVFAMPYDPAKHPGTFEISLTGGGYKIGTEDSAYGIQVINPAALFLVQGPIGSIVKNDPEYKFGGSVLVGYYFPNSSINVDLSYFGTRNHIDDSNSAIVTTSLVPSGFILLPGSGFTTSAYDSDYDYANIEIGSLTRVNNNCLIFNPQVGLSYARLKTDQTVGYAGSNIPVGIGFIAEKDTSFKGFGPSIGFDLTYFMCNPISLSGSFRYNALVGNINSNYAVASNVNSYTSVDFVTENTLVSLIQSEIALGYAIEIADTLSGNVAIGYQLTKSIGNAENMQFPADVGAGLISFSDNITNTNIHGYFLRVTMDIGV